jgi:hypothetical protein
MSMGSSQEAEGAGLHNERRLESDFPSQSTMPLLVPAGAGFMVCPSSWTQI